MTVACYAEPLVPGTGQKIEQVGDDFEDPQWSYRPHLPKSSFNLDEQKRAPGGESVNGRWYEGIKRGDPDLIRRVATPEGGLEGSLGALLLRSVHTGVPGRPSYRMQQDDFIANVNYELGGFIPVSQSPSVVVRVFMPPVEEWENRSGCTFAFRVALDTQIRKTSSGLFASSKVEREIYYPGFFFEFAAKEQTGRDYDSAHLRIRANQTGQDYDGPAIQQTGWWTFGMSFTPDGQVHYFAKPGVEDLTAEDHIASHYPYGYRCERFRTFFFNVCSADDGRTWSTPWIIDDAEVYFAAE